MAEHGIDNLYTDTPDLKSTYNPSVVDEYVLATATTDLDNNEEWNVILLVGAGVDYDVFEDEAKFKHLIECFRDKSA